MSNQVKLAAKLSKDPEYNGLDDYAVSLAEDDQQVLCALVWLKVRETSILAATHTKRPVVEIVRIEPFGSPGNLDPAVIEAVIRAYKERTGADPLPIEQVEE